MNTLPYFRGSLCAAVLAMTPLAARADFANFGNFSNFTVNVNDAGAAPSYAVNSVQLTNSGANEARSLFFNTPQNISGPFTAQFSYVCQNLSNFYMGAAFVLQNSPAGAQAVGTRANYLGYSGNTMTGKSAAVTLEGNYASAFNSGFYTNGNLGGGSSSTSPVAIQSGDPIVETVTYDGLFLHEHLLDTVTAATYDVSYLENLPTILGGSTAYVGLTASTNAGSPQTFSNFSFSTAAPEPASLGILGCGVLGVMTRRRR